MDVEQTMMDAILKVLSEKIDPKVLKKVNIISLRKKLWEAINAELFYKLLKEKKLNLHAGFGTFLVKEIKQKEKKVFDKKKNEMVTKNVKGSKIVFRPGDALKEFL